MAVPQPQNMRVSMFCPAIIAMYSAGMNHSPPSHPSLMAPLAMALVGTALFSLMDALMKGASLAIGAYNAMLWRALIGAVVMGSIYALRCRQRPSRLAMRYHVLRSVAATVMTMFFFWGLMRTPLAEAIALSFIAPLITLYLARVILGEQLNNRAIGATLVGLAGVAVILFGKLRGDYGADALLGAGAILISAASYAYNLILQRLQAAHSDPLEVSAFQNIFMCLLFALAAPWLARVPGGEHWPGLIGAAVLASISLMLLSWAYGRAETQYLLPIEYTAFLWAVLFGWIFFNERVTPTTWMGAVLILGACWLAAKAGRPGHPVPVEPA